LTTDTFDYAGLLRPDLPPPAVKWTGFPKYNFVGGHNDADSVPVDGLVEAAARVLRREGRTLSTYGLNSGSLGYRPLREFIARKLADDAGIACSADEILITSGSLQGLDLVNAVLLSPGDTVILEEMTYGGTITRLNRLGVKMVGVPVDRDGLRTDAVEAALRDLAARGIRPKFIYTIPTVQNPTATILSEARRAELLRLSERFGVPIFEDDCYADLTWDGRRPQALRGMARDERVIHIGSFSKTIAPALRIGFLVARWPLMSRILSLKGDGGSGALEQMVLAEYCQDNFWPHVKELRATLKRKADALMDALRAQFGSDAQFEYPTGGIFLWLKLPDAVDTTRLAQVALQAGVAINPGVEWTTDADAGKRRLRICFAHPPVQVIQEGVARLAQVCQREFGIPSPRAESHR
jgi:2-aminoadipate transaminase